ncbi:MAG: cmcC [Acidimicrobiia bacterium]|nr:cmcC [Acidimicrobiia bacterium]
MSSTATMSSSPGRDPVRPSVTTTGTRATRALGIVVLLGFGWLALFALVFSPRDEVQKDWVRFLYLHVGSIFISYVAFGVTALCSALFLWKRTRSRVWDRVAGASAEIGVLFLGITLLTGSLWGKGTWGVYWTWDARLTTTALLLVLFVGYLALRGVEGDRDVRAKRAAIAGLVAAADIPIVNQAINWWRTLHQGRTFRILGEATIDGLMLFSVFVALIAFALLYVWLLIHRLRIAQMEEILEDRGLEQALAERMAEGDPVAAS